jgi:ribosomal protein L37AE/L43A
MMRTKMECVGCRRTFVARRATATPICNSCQRDEAKYRRARLKHEQNLRQLAIDRVAEAETQGLPRRDTFTPLMGESIIAMMQRG